MSQITTTPTVTVRIPATLRSYSNGASKVACQGTTVAQIIADLNRQCAGLAEKIVDDATGGLRPFVNIYVAGEDVRFLDGLQTLISDGATVSLLPAVSGGC